MEHRLPRFNALNIQVCPPLLLSVIIRQELTAEERYPNNISSATAVPAWAYLDVVTMDIFDPTSAIQAVSLPESTAANNKPSTSSSVSSSQTSTPASRNVLIDTSVIIGITVGSTLGVILIAALILYLLRKENRQSPSSAFARTRTTPSMGAAAAGFRSASRHPSTLVSGGYSSWDHGRKGPALPPAVFQFDHKNGIPWSPPLSSSSPPRAISSTSAQSLLSTDSHGSRYTHSDDGIDYHNLPSGPETGHSLENPVA